MVYGIGSHDGDRDVTQRHNQFYQYHHLGDKKAGKYCLVNVMYEVHSIRRGFMLYGFKYSF